MSHTRMDTTILRAKLREGTAGQQIIAKQLLNRRARRALQANQPKPVKRG